MEKVLQIFPQMNNAGTEKVIMNLYNNIDREKMQFDFLLNKQGVLDENIKKLGGKIYYINFKNKKEYYKKLIDFFEKNHYDIIHVHTQGNMELILKAAKECKIKCRIIHSHNSRQDILPILKILKLYRNIKIENNATDFLACSKDAAKWLFPNKYKRAKIVYNAIEMNNFSFNTEIRKKTRKDLGIKDNEEVIVNVGRFAKQKNHVRLIKIANEMIKKQENVKFVLVGNGKLENIIKAKVNKYNMQDKFIFLGNRKDVNEILMAGDLFLFPTLHEGLGIVVIEAQFSGLKCITSERVPEEADIGFGLLEKVQLSKNDKYWCDAISKGLSEKIDREKVCQTNTECNYNIKEIAKDMQKFYLEKIGEKKL